ncbi:tyrosine-type recombinase/integrase [Novosphingobium meiothermophilum]|uniref:tyrosine-type recombinase/integrase n=1 Tax=Novosphingobium meiothermophilum TaxID=2202251 RepID=UPI000D6EAD95|nr:site-specific integrase [Novosphingobium meiothermophilum]
MARLPELKRKASGIYYLDLRADGGGRVSLNTRDRAKALELRREFLAKGVAPSATESSRNREPQVTMRSLFERAENTVWHHSQAKSQATIRSNIKILNSLIGDEPATAMTFTRLEQLVDELKALGYAPATVKRKMDAVSKVLRMATKWTDPDGKPLLAAKPPMPTIRVANTKDRVLTRAEEDQVFACIEKRRLAEPGRNWRRFAALIRFLLDTGARLGEALATGPEDLSVVSGEDGEGVLLVTFARYRTKNDKPRSVPLTGAARAALEGLKDDLGMVRLKDDRGNIREKPVYFPISNGTAWYMWENIREDMKPLGFNVDDVTLHTMRHTCLTRLAQGGMQLLQLMLWAGHQDPKVTTSRYLHFRPSDLLGGIEILQGSNGTTKESPIFREGTANRAAFGTVSLQ